MRLGGRAVFHAALVPFRRHVPHGFVDMCRRLRGPGDAKYYDAGTYAPPSPPCDAHRPAPWHCRPANPCGQPTECHGLNTIRTYLERNLCRARGASFGHFFVANGAPRECGQQCRSYLAHHWDYDSLVISCGRRHHLRRRPLPQKRRSVPSGPPSRVLHGPCTNAHLSLRFFRRRPKHLSSVILPLGWFGRWVGEPCGQPPPSRSLWSVGALVHRNPR